MFGLDKNKERERFYLLPGQGGKAARRKHRLMLAWAVVIGLVAAGLLVLLLHSISSI